MEKGQIVSDKVKLMDIFSKEFWFVIPESKIICMGK